MRPGETSIVLPLIFANIAVFIIQSLTQGQGSTGEGFSYYLTLDWGSLKNLELWRLGTYMFAHANFMHILVNMWGIWIFGRPLEDRIGSHRFLYLYLVSGLVGGGVWLAFNHSPLYIAGDLELYPRVLGASGSLFGILVAAAMVAPNLRYMLLIPPVPIRLKTLVAVYAVIELLAVQRGSQSGVANLAHLGGLIGGYFYMVFKVPGSGSGMTRAVRSSASRLHAWIRRLFFRVQSSSPAHKTPPRDHSAASHEDNLDESIDEILDKIGREGLSSLTAAERRKLEDARNRLKQNRGR